MGGHGLYSTSQFVINGKLPLCVLRIGRNGPPIGGLAVDAGVLRRRSPAHASGPSLSLKVTGSVANQAFSPPGTGRTRPYSAMLCAGMSDK
jgi:hypothetical protein